MEIFRQITANSIKIAAYPFMKELAMEAYLMENEEILSLDNSSFSDVTVLDAEISLKGGGRATKSDGRLDLLAMYGNEYLAIVELKINQINLDTLKQLESYLDQANQIIEKYKYWEEEIDPKWVGVMIGDSICPELQKKIAEGYVFKGIPIAAKTMRRFRSEKGEIFVITDTYFKDQTNSKNLDKLLFKEKLFTKGRLVHAVIKDYVENNPSITYATLERAFPINLQGSQGCFRSYEDAMSAIVNGRKRNFIKPEELIQLSNEIIAISSQWGIRNIPKFISNAKKLGYKISWNN
jgi:hypothetical protein